MMDKKTYYNCPDPTCLFTTDDATELSDHVNENHDGEWDEPHWPDADDNDGW